MKLLPVLQNPGRDLFLLSEETTCRYVLYDDRANHASWIDQPARIIGRASWEPFDGLPDVVANRAQLALES